MTEYIKRLLFYAGAVPEEYNDCKREINEITRERLGGYLKVAAGICFVMTLVSLVLDIVAENFAVYAGMAVSSVIMIFVLNKFGSRYPAATSICRLAFESVIGMLGIIIGTINSPTKQATTAIVLIVLLPMLFIVPPIIKMLEMLVYTVLFIICAVYAKGLNVARMDILNAVAFYVLAMIVSTYVMQSMVENVINIKKLHYVAENDMNTKMRNRNAYENEMSAFALRCKSTLGCVYVDVNGLHQLNNTKGHAEGDRMLQIVAEKIIDTYGAEKSFRVGGDEFVAFVLDRAEDELRESAEKLMAAVEAEGYSVAVGVAAASAGGIDVGKLVKLAEQRMYSAKEEYYRKNFPDMAETEIRR